jgi:hypothetical protein
MTILTGAAAMVQVRQLINSTLAQKTVWNSQTLLDALYLNFSSLSFSSPAYVQGMKLANDFKTYMREDGVESIGRKQFITWLDNCVLKRTGNEMIIEPNATTIAASEGAAIINKKLADNDVAPWDTPLPFTNRTYEQLILEQSMSFPNLKTKMEEQLWTELQQVRAENTELKVQNKRLREDVAVVLIQHNKIEEIISSLINRLKETVIKTS